MIRRVRNCIPIVIAGGAFLASMPTAKAAGQGVMLTHLQGASIDAEITRTERVQIDNGRWEIQSIVFREQIYISKSGRIFDRQSWGDNVNQGHWDDVSHADTQQLRFENNFGFRRFNYDAPAGMKSTYIMITSISIQNTDVGFICDISLLYALEKGQKQYIKPTWKREVLLVDWYKTFGQRCLVVEGNVFNSPAN